MEVKRKLAILADAAKHDASCASGGGRRKAPEGGLGDAGKKGICHSYTPDGRCVSLLKILLTNRCIYDCRYCESRLSSNVERAQLTPEEVARLTIDFYKRNYIEGLFLSSAIVKSPDHTMEQLVRVAELLRGEHAFGGYIHLKVPPGVSPELVARASRLADRLSVNTELPTEADLASLAPEKSFGAIEGVMRDVRDVITEARDVVPAGQTTQLVVGATDTPDRTILATTTRLYRSYGLRRVYFAAFSPIVHGDRVLPSKPPPLVREHRLYEADWLLRFYGFDAEELFAEGADALSLDVDPKLAWALRHRERFPVDVNRASREELLRVPGLGVKNVRKILGARTRRALRLADLARIRVPLRRAAPFLVTADGASHAAKLLDGRDLAARVRPPEQLGLFDAAVAARTGQL